jgi:predicted permease
VSPLGLPRPIRALLRAAAGPLADDIEGDLSEWMARWARHGSARRARARGIWTALAMTPRLLAGRARDAATRAVRLRGWSLDTRLALRLVGKHPGLSVVAVLALAGTMSLATGLFTFVREAIYADLPVEGGDRIVALDLRDEVTRRQLVPTWAEMRAWSEGDSGLEHVGAFNTERFTLALDEMPVASVAGARLTPSIFDFNAPVPVLGTLFTDAMVAETPEVVVLRQDVWEAHFGADPEIVGSTIDVSGTAHRVVGIVPRDWGFPSDQGVWVPLPVPVTADPAAHAPGTMLVGRLPVGGSAAVASARSQALIRAAVTLEDRRPSVDARPFVRALNDPGTEAVIGTVIAALILLVLVAAANVANLVLARTEARRAELAVRSALGASRGRLVAQLFVEALVLTTVGAVLALVLVGWGVGWLETVVVEMPYWVDFGPDPLVFGFAAGLAALAAVVAGAWPALRATRSDMADGVRGVRGGTFGIFGQSVIVAELAVSVAFLGAAFAVGESFLGYTRGSVVAVPEDEVLTATLYMPWEGERADTGDIEVFSRRVRAGIAEMLDDRVGPWGVGFTLDLPGTEAQRSRVELDGIEGVHVVRGVATDDAMFRVVDVGATRGRIFDPRDLETDAPRVVLVNEPFVAGVLGGRNAVGRRLRFHYGDGSTGDWAEIVGVVPDLGHNPGDRRAGAAVYRPMAGANYMSVMLRPTPGGGVAPQDLLPALRKAAFDLDPELQVRDADLLADAGAAERAALTGVGTSLFILGAMALMLSAAGLYAVLSFGVSKRTREIGVRIALGAGTARIARAIGRRVFVGLVLGMGGGLALGGALFAVIRTFPFEVRLDPWLHLGVPGALLWLVGGLAVLPPVRRALGIQPAEALRAD